MASPRRRGLVPVWLAALIGWGGIAPSAAAAQSGPVVRAMAGNGFGDAYGAGVGATLGVETPFVRGKRFFVGLRTVYHFGSHGTLADFAAEGASAPTGTASQVQAGLEVGTTWMTAPLFIRTVGGLGVARVDVDIESGDSDLEGTHKKLAYGPGLLIALPSDGGTFTGLEIRWSKVRDLDSAISVYATVGRRLF